MMLVIAAEPNNTLLPIGILYAGEWTKIIKILLALSPVKLKQSIQLFFNPTVHMIIEIYDCLFMFLHLGIKQNLIAI